MRNIRFGYSFWGFLGDNKLDESFRELSTPDGNATYSWSIIHEAQNRGWTVHLMQKNRDLPAVEQFGPENFSAFNQTKRGNAWTRSFWTHGLSLPELDVLLIEWRWPIPGKNCEMVNGLPSFPAGVGIEPDLLRQIQIMHHYKEKGTKIIIWDLDHKLTEEDERAWLPDAIFETSVCPRMQYLPRTRVEPPTVVSDLLEHPTIPSNPDRLMVYVGSRYERDDVIQEYLARASEIVPGKIEFWGNWTKEPNLSECKAKWPHFSYNGRITTKDFRRVYGDAVSCPLLAKRSYLETGFITPRPWEALLFGTIPIGLIEHHGIFQYTLFRAFNGEDFAALCKSISQMSLKWRDEKRRENVEKISFMDVKYFIDKIEGVLDGSGNQKISTENVHE